MLRMYVGTLVILLYLGPHCVRSEDLSVVASKAKGEIADFAQVAIESPKSEVSVVMFFQHRVDLREVASFLRHAPVGVKAFRHGDSRSSGGYILRPGESLEDAVINYRERHLVAMNVIRRRALELLANPPNKEVVPSILERLSDLGEALKSVKGREPHVIGVELEGEAGAISELSKTLGFVSSIEMNRGFNENVVPTNEPNSEEN